MKKYFLIFAIPILFFIDSGNVFAYNDGFIAENDIQFRGYRSGGSVTDNIGTENLMHDGDTSTFTDWHDYSEGVDFVTADYVPESDSVGIVGFKYLGAPVKFTFFSYTGENVVLDVGDYEQDILNNINVQEFKTVQMEFTTTDRKVYELELYDGEPQDIVPPSEVTNLTKQETDQTVTLNWTNPSDEDFSHVNIYKDNELIVSDISTNSYSVTGLTNDTQYSFKVTTVDTNGNESTGTTIVATPSIPVDTTPPSSISNLTYSVTESSVSFNYDLPTDEDFSHLRITMNGSEVSNNHTLNTFEKINLDPETEYVFAFYSVDESGNESTGNIEAITTKPETDLVAPEAPTGLDVTSANNGLRVSWNPNAENDIEGYNVYVNGELYNSSLIGVTYYHMTNLENGVSYDIGITAVDTSGNESAMTTLVSGTPSEDAVPIIGFGYDLNDVGTGVESWFSSLWLLLAFAVGIPLSFYIANRIKGLFIA